MQKEENRREKTEQDTEHEQLFFQDELPEEIRQALTPEIRRQYFLWDEIIKREIQLHPRIVLPLIGEVFRRRYPQNVKIELLSTEYAVRRIHAQGEKVLQSVFSDLLIKIGKELYHLECQMEENREMVLRMLEYDVHIALVHGRKENTDGEQSRFALSLPQSVILCLDHSHRVPDSEQCLIRLQDGTEYVYRVPVLKVQQYTTEMIRDKHLSLLIPFLPIRFRSALRSRSPRTREQARKDLTGLLAECIMILKQEKENGILTEETRNDIAEMLICACDHLFGGDSGLIQEVHDIMEPAIKLRREIVQELQESNQNLQEKLQRLQRKDRELETGIQRIIQKAQSEGKTREEARRMLQEIFSLEGEEAGEKVAKHWK